MNTTQMRFVSSMAAVGTMVGLSVVMAMPASAADSATNSQGQCLASPSRLTITNHAATFRDNTTVTPGTSAEFRTEQRWSREGVIIIDIAHDYTQYSRVTPKVDAVMHWKYLSFVPGQKEILQEQGQFSRVNPGHGEQTYMEYKYSKPTTIVETEYKKPDVKLKYTYVKYVQGVVQVKHGNRWDTVDSFGWELWPENLTKTSFENKPVIESGGHNAVLAEWKEGGQQYRKVTTNYQYQNTNAPQEVPTGTYTYQYSSTNPGSPWVSTGRTREVAGPTVYYNNGNWTTDVNPSGWTKIDQRSVNNPDYVAPFTEYRAQDGSATTDANNAGWFPETSFEGWTPYGQRKQVVTQEFIADQTFYLTRDAQGNLGQSTNEADASWFTSSDGIEPKWAEFGRSTQTEGSPERTVYLTVNDEGTFGETEDSEDASWIRTDNTTVDLTIWQQMVDEFGDPLVKSFMDESRTETVTEYYVPGGEPTRELGDSNWTTDKPEGWTFVDDRKVETKKATPPVTTVTSVLDKAAWSDQSLVAATYGPCGLAETGSNPWGPAGIALALAAVGTTAVVAARKRGRHVAEPVTVNS